MSKRDIWGAVKGIVSSVAPTVATALGGPVGGIAANMIKKALGVDSDEAAIQALQSDPEAVLKLKIAEIDFDKFLVEADIRKDELVVEDRKDARDLSKTLGTIWPQMTIVIALTFMIAGVIYALFKTAPPPETENILFMVLGQLTTAWAASISFFVGTTKSSADKSKQIAGGR